MTPEINLLLQNALIQSAPTQNLPRTIISISIRNAIEKCDHYLKCIAIRWCARASRPTRTGTDELNWRKQNGRHSGFLHVKYVNANRRVLGGIDYASAYCTGPANDGERRQTTVNDGERVRRTRKTHSDPSSKSNNRLGFSFKKEKYDGLKANGYQLNMLAWTKTPNNGSIKPFDF